MASGGAVIRHGKREDVETISSLIHELAAYEKFTDGLETTPDLPEKTLSHQSPDGSFTPGYAKILLITAPEDEVAGIAVYFYNYSTWKAVPGVYLENIFIKPKYKKRGYGKAVLRALANEVAKVGGQRLDFICLSWNTLGLELFQGLGAKKTDAWVGLRIDGNALAKLTGP